MSDPLSDPRAIDLQAAQPEVVSSIATGFTQISLLAAQAATALRGLHDPSWNGAAADAFHRTLGPLPGELDRVGDTYGRVAGALSTYEGQLATLQPQFNQLAGQLQAARRAQAAAQASANSAAGQLSKLLAAHPVNDPAALVSPFGLTPAWSPAMLPPKEPQTPLDQARESARSAHAALGSAQRAVGDLERQCFTILDTFDSERGVCHTATAKSAGQAPSRPWYDTAMHDAGNFVTGLGKGVWNGVTGLPGAIVAVTEHPSNLDAWKTLATDVVITAGTLSLIVAPEDAGLLATFTEGAETVATVGTEAKMGIDLAQGQYGEAAGDGLSLYLGKVVPGGNAADRLGVGASKLEKSTENAKVLKEYSQAIGEEGKTPVQALLGMNAKERSTAFERIGRNSMADPSAAIRTADAEAQAARDAYVWRGRPLNYAIDGAVIDPLKEHVIKPVGNWAAKPFTPPPDPKPCGAAAG